MIADEKRLHIAIERHKTVIVARAQATKSLKL